MKQFYNKDLDCAYNELIQVYNNYFKPAYADLVSYLGAKPDKILIEIENTFSHLMVSLDSNQNDSLRKENIWKAYNHIVRATLDCYKILWIKLNEDIEKIHNEDVKKLALNISIEKFLKLKKQFKEAIKKARQEEIAQLGKNPLKALPYYIEAIEIGKRIIDSLDENKEKEINKFTLKAITKREIIIAIITGIIGSIVGSLFTLFLF